MRNFPVTPPQQAVLGDVTVYHAQPHGNCDPQNQPVTPDFLIIIDSTIEDKTAMLAEHKSQKEWLDRSQGMDAYLETMKGLSREMGDLTEKCEYAEGWRKHSHLGYCQKDADPLGDLLGESVISLQPS
jgi:LmbE family N-acetylglucosaminyl deacetylase